MKNCSNSLRDKDTNIPFSQSFSQRSLLSEYGIFSLSLGIITFTPASKNDWKLLSSIMLFIGDTNTGSILVSS